MSRFVILVLLLNVLYVLGVTDFEGGTTEAYCHENQTSVAFKTVVKTRQYVQTYKKNMFTKTKKRTRKEEYTTEEPYTTWKIVIKCCNGFKSSERLGKNVCEPICEAGCPQNGHCIEPEICACDRGYTRANFSCVPICNSGCLHGKCVLPDKCECDTDYEMSVDGCVERKQAIPFGIAVRMNVAEPEEEKKQDEAVFPVAVPTEVVPQLTESSFISTEETLTDSTTMDYTKSSSWPSSPDDIIDTTESIKSCAEDYVLFEGNCLLANDCRLSSCQTNSVCLSNGICSDIVTTTAEPNKNTSDAQANLMRAVEPETTNSWLVPLLITVGVVGLASLGFVIARHLLAPHGSLNVAGDKSHLYCEFANQPGYETHVVC